MSNDFKETDMQRKNYRIVLVCLRVLVKLQLQSCGVKLWPQHYLQSIMRSLCILTLTLIISNVKVKKPKFHNGGSNSPTEITA